MTGASTIEVSATQDLVALKVYVRESSIVKKFTDGKEIKRVIVVPGKLVNFIVE